MINLNSKYFDKPIWSLSRLAQVLPNIPGDLLHVIPTLIGKPFSNSFREWIMVVVAVENRSWSCQFAHITFGRLSGLSEDEVQALLSQQHDKLSSSEKIVISFVRDLVHRDFASYDESLYKDLGKYYTDVQCKAIVSTAHLMNLFNRAGNTFDAACAELLHGKNQSGLKILDLGVISTLFLCGALPMLPMLAILRYIQIHEK